MIENTTNRFIKLKIKSTKKYQLLIRMLLFIAAILCSHIPVYATTNAAYSINVEVEYGEDGVIKYNQPTKIYIIITNNGEEFGGKVEVVLQGDDNSDTIGQSVISSRISYLSSDSSSANIFAHSKEIHLPSGKQQTIDFEVLLSYEMQGFQIVITDVDSKETIYSTSIRVNNYYAIEEKVIIGVLGTQTNESDELFESILFLDYQTSIKQFSVSLDMLESSYTDLNLFDVIFVKDYPLEKLSAQAKSNLMRWIYNGGILFFDANNVSDELSAMFEETYHQVFTIKNEQEDLQSELGSLTVSKLVYGSGSIHLVSAPINDIINLSSKSEARQCLTQMLETSVGSQELQYIAQLGYWCYSNSYSSILTMLQGMYFDKIPDINIYAVILFLYCIIVGPLLYLVLRRIRKREVIWGGIAAASVIFVIFIYLIGRDTRMTAPFIDYIKIKTITDNTIEEDIYFTVKAPFNSGYNLFVDNSYNIASLKEGIISQGQQFDTYKDIADDYQVEIEYQKEENKIRIQGVEVFSTELFHAGKIENSSEVLTSEIDVTYFAGNLSGEFQNELAYDLEDVILVFYDYVAIIGDVKSGETIDLSSIDVMSSNRFLYSAEKMEDSREKVTFEEKRHKAVWKYFIEDNLLRYSKEAYILGFTEDSDFDLQLDSGYEARGATLISMPITIRYEKDDMVYNPYLNDFVYIESYSTDYYSGIYYVHEEEMIAIFDLGSGLTELTLLIKEPEIDELESGIQFMDNMYFLNIETGEYERINFSSESLSHLPPREERALTDSFSGKLRAEISPEELEKYISEENQMTVKYVIENMDDSNNYYAVPIFEAIGRKTDAAN